MVWYDLIFTGGSLNRSVHKRVEKILFAAMMEDNRNQALMTQSEFVRFLKCT